MMKALLTSILCIVMSVFLIGCSSKKSTDSDYTPEDTTYVSNTDEAETTTTTTATSEEGTAPSEDSLIRSDDNVPGKMYVNENTTLSRDAAELLIKNLIQEFYTESPITPTEPSTYILNSSAAIENESMKTRLANYISNSNSTTYYSNISEYGTYYSVTGLSENEIVLFEMDNGHVAISEPGSEISDYSMKYKFLFTFRNSDSTTAYYWCAQEETNWVSYASHRVVRVWVYNTDANTYSCIDE